MELLPSNRPHLPEFSTKLPKSFQLLVSEWQNVELEQYVRERDRRHWPNKFQQAFKKRYYLIQKIQEQLPFVRSPTGGAFEGDQEDRMMAAARIMDERRGQQSLANFHRDLHRGDPTVRRRRPKRRRDEENTQQPPTRQPTVATRRQGQERGWVLDVAAHNATVEGQRRRQDTGRDRANVSNRQREMEERELEEEYGRRITIERINFD